MSEIGRLLHTHRLDPLLTCAALGNDAAQAARFASAAKIEGAANGECAALFLNFLIWLELRCGHGSRAMWQRLSVPRSN